MTELWRGIDTDNYDQAVSVDRFKSLFDNHGVRFNIIGLEAGMPFAAVQRDNSLAAGLVVPLAYKLPYWQDNDVERMKQAAGFGLPIAIDVEYGTGMPVGGFAATIQRIQECKDALVAEGMYWGIYSSPSEWFRLTGNTQQFAGDNAWAATYPYHGLPPEDFMPDFAAYPAFGGLVPVIWQYADQCYDEADFDMNAMPDPTPAPAPAPRVWLYGDEMAGEEVVGNQRWLWHRGVNIDRIGTEDASRPGTHLHNEGGTWVELAP